MRKIHSYGRVAKGAIGGLLLCFSVQLFATQPAARPPHASDLLSPSSEVLLVVSGAIAQTNIGSEAHFDRQMLAQLAQHTVYTHTLVTDGVKRFDGVLARDLFAVVGVDPEQTTLVVASALNDYEVLIPMADFYTYDVLLATHMDGEQLQPTDKGPLWVIYPRDEWHQLKDIRYDYRWVWHLNRLYIR